MKFKAVVFDMDGVMFDTESVCMKSWDTVGEEMGIGKAGYMVYKTLGMTAQAAIKILQNEFGKDFDAKLFKQKGRECSYKYFNDFGVPEKPFLHEALEYLKEKRYTFSIVRYNDAKNRWNCSGTRNKKNKFSSNNIYICQNRPKS